MSVRSLESISKLASDYELVVLPDGTEILRERQTKAQAKMQALKIQIRNEKLRKALISLTEQVAISAERKHSEEITQQVQLEANVQPEEYQSNIVTNEKLSIINPTETVNFIDNLDQAIHINKPSAIQKQMMSNSKTKTEAQTDEMQTNKERQEITNSNKQYQPKSAKTNAFNLRKLFFGQLANK